VEQQGESVLTLCDEGSPKADEEVRGRLDIDRTYGRGAPNGPDLPTLCVQLSFGLGHAHIPSSTPMSFRFHSAMELRATIDHDVKAR
jgi:hypothetical protein